MDQVMENLAGTFLLLQARWESTEGFVQSNTSDFCCNGITPLHAVGAQTKGKHGGRESN